MINESVRDGRLRRGDGKSRGTRRRTLGTPRLRGDEFHTKVG